MMVATTDETFERFFEDHYPGVCRALWLSLGDGCDPEDAAQEAFLRAFQKWRVVARLDRPATWVFVVAVREARRQGRRRHRDATQSFGGQGHRDATAGVDSQVTIMGALSQLAPRQRMAIVLRYHADLPVKEIARAMRCREGTVKATLHTALERLRALPLEERTSTEVEND
jgi:RNA polymerase sigma factor (sigma-70 family)